MLTLKQFTTPHKTPPRQPCRRCKTTKPPLTPTYWTNHKQTLCPDCTEQANHYFDSTFWPKPPPHMIDPHPLETPDYQQPEMI